MVYDSYGADTENMEYGKHGGMCTEIEWTTDEQSTMFVEKNYSLFLNFFYYLSFVLN